MKIIFTVNCLFILCTFNVNANLLQATAESNVVGISDAIFALQIASGMVENKSGHKVNFSEYFPQEKAEYFYVRKGWDDYYEEVYHVNSYVYTDFENIDGKQIFVQYWFDDLWYGWKDYFKIVNGTVYYLGWHDSYSNDFLIPPLITGKNQMTIGDAYPTIFQHNGKPYWNKYRFCGIETVETPAGKFDDCIIISKIKSRSWGPTFFYYAKNIGLVKEINTSSNWYISELSGVKIRDIVIPKGFETLTCENSWEFYNGNQRIKTGPFIIRYFHSEVGSSGAIVISDYPTIGEKLHLNIKSEDGVNFAVYDPYDLNSDELFILSILDDNFSGNYQISETEKLILSGKCN